MARFLTDNDYRTLVKDSNIQAVISDEAERGVAENMAQEEIESYLRDRYDMAAMFSKTDTARPPMLVMYMIDIALYHLFSRLAGRQIPQTRIDRYNRAIDWLERAQAGRVTVDWERKEDEDTGEEAMNFRFGSKKKFESDGY